MSKFESASHEFLYVPDRDSVRALAEAGLQAGAVMRQEAQEGSILPSKDKHAVPIEPKVKHVKPIGSEDEPAYIDCEWDRAMRALEERDRDDREHVATTVNKYFSKIDRSNWFGFGKDGELDKNELLNFLLSEDAAELSEHETADFVKALRNFDEIRDAKSNVGCIMHGGITREDLWAYGKNEESIYGRISYDLKDYRHDYDIRESLDNK